MNRKVQKYQTTGRRGGKNRKGTTRSTELIDLVVSDLEVSETIKVKKSSKQIHKTSQCTKRSSTKDVNLLEEESSVSYVETETKKNEKENKRKRMKGLPTSSDTGLRIKSNEDLLKSTDDSQNDKIIEISKQIEVEKARTSKLLNIDIVMDQIQLTLESMSKSELLKLCKLKIEEEITVKTNKLEKDKKVISLEMSLSACLKEMNFLKKKNKELKSAISTIYEEYKKEKKYSIIEVDLKNNPETEYTAQPTNFPVSITSAKSTGSSHNFILPDNPPEDDEFITCDQIKAEDIDGQEAEYVTGDTEQTNSFPTSIKQENLAPNNLQNSPNNEQQGEASMKYTLITSESDNPSVSCNLASPGAVLHEKTDDSLDIEDKIPHALITCNKSPLRNDNENPPTKKKVMPGNTHVVEVFNVLQSIDLTNELSKMNNAHITSEKSTENLLNNCTPRIIMTESLAPKSAASDNNLSSEPIQPKHRNNTKASVIPLKFIPVSPNSTHVSTNQTTSVSQSDLLKNIQPIMTGTNPMQLAFLMNSPGGQCPKQVFFTISPQNKMVLTPQIADVSSLTNAGNQKSAPKRAEKSNPSATQTSTTVNSAPHILMSKLMAINTNTKMANKSEITNKPKIINKISNIIRKRPATEDVFDLTDDEPSDKMAAINELQYENGQIISMPSIINAANKSQNIPTPSHLKRIILSKTNFKNMQSFSHSLKAYGGPIKLANLSPGGKIQQNSKLGKVLISPLNNKLSTQKLIKSVVKLTTNGQTSIIGYKEENMKNSELQK